MVQLFGVRNSSVFDEWSFAHFASGFIAGKSKMFSATGFLILHSLFEWWENSSMGVEFWIDNGWTNYNRDTWANVVGDTVAAMFGYWIANKSV